MVFMAIKDPQSDYVVLVGRKKSEEQKRQKMQKGAQRKVRSCLQLALVRITNLKEAPYCRLTMEDDYAIDHENFSKGFLTVRRFGIRRQLFHILEEELPAGGVAKERAAVPLQSEHEGGDARDPQERGDQVRVVQASGFGEREDQSGSERRQCVREVERVVLQQDQV